jgi:hypothetical protein
MFPTPRQHAWLMRWFQDTQTTYNLALRHVLEKKLHKLEPGELHLGTLERTLQSTLVTTKKGVEILPKRHHKILRTPKV